MCISRDADLSDIIIHTTRTLPNSSNPQNLSKTQFGKSTLLHIPLQQKTQHRIYQYLVNGCYNGRESL
jgi:hypothetical protein